jgi:hypothetical protein
MLERSAVSKLGFIASRLLFPRLEQWFTAVFAMSFAFVRGLSIWWKT